MGVEEREFCSINSNDIIIKLELKDQLDVCFSDNSLLHYVQDLFINDTTGI